MVSKYFKGEKKNNSILYKRILSVLIVTVFSALLPLQAYAYTSLSISPITMGYHSVPESSGTVASRAYSGIYWMISDWMSSGNILAIHAVNSHGDTVKQFTLKSASNWN